MATSNQQKKNVYRKANPQVNGVKSAVQSANKQTSSGVYYTRDGGTVTSPKKSTTASNAVTGALAGVSAAKKNNTTTGGAAASALAGVSATKKNTTSSKSTAAKSAAAGASAGKTTQSERVAAYSSPSSVATTRAKKNPDTGADATVLGALAGAEASKNKKAAAGALAGEQYTPYLDDDDEDATRIGTSSQTINSPTGNTVKYGSDNWNYADDQIVRDVFGERMTFGELKKRKAEGYYDTHRVGQSSGTADSDRLGAYGDYESGSGSSYSDAYGDYIQAAIAAINGQKESIDNEAAAAKQKAYANYMRSKLGMGEQTAGMATGTADSLAVQNDLTLQNNLNTIEQERMNAYADIDSQAAQTEAEGNLKLAELAAEAEQQAYERAQAEREWAYQLAKDSQGGGSDSGYSISDITKMISAGLISPDQGRQMLGLSGTGMMTAQDYYDKMRNRLDFNNLTAENIKKDLDYMLENGMMTNEEYNKAYEHYNLGNIKLN